jgi:hypothetical protein
MKVRRWVDTDNFKEYDIQTPISEDDTIETVITKITKDIQRQTTDIINVSVQPYLWAKGRSLAFTIMPPPNDPHPWTDGNQALWPVITSRQGGSP